jgi:hypothetical protein
MSVQSAIINLVRKSFLATSTANDYTTGSPLLTRHDEIAFVDPHGDPCAIPTEPGIDNIDYEYAYVTGARGHSLRGSLVKIGLNIDYIDNTLKRKLDQWRQERAHVWVSPNMGKNTLFSWRPADVSGANYTVGGSQARDLTGNYALTSVFGAFLRYWDTARGIFLPKSSSNRAPLVHTPGGAGLVASPSTMNRMRPTYPVSATMSNAATASGWIIGGADAADVSVALATNGFGQTDCPHSLRVSIAAHASGDRYLYAADQFNPAAGANYAGYPFVNTTSATATVWLRGQLPDQFAFQFGALTGADMTLRTIGGARLDGWTPFSVSYPPVAWATNPPTLWIICHSATGLACSFEIGPVMVQQSGMPAANVWSAQITGGTASGNSHVSTSAAVTLPGQGTIMASFHVPEDMNAAWRGVEYCSIFGNTNLFLRARVSRTTEYFRFTSISPSVSVNTASIAVGGYLIPGKICTVAVTWDGSSQKIYANGELVLTAITAATTIPLGGSSSVLSVGRDSPGYNCSPLAMLTMRIDEGAMTATEIGQLHTALTDPIALALAKTCSGRAFRITKTPQMLRSSYGGSQILGTVELEQVGYDANTAEPMSVEASIV